MSNLVKIDIQKEKITLKVTIKNATNSGWWKGKKKKWIRTRRFSEEKSHITF